jgi:integrase
VHHAAVRYEKTLASFGADPRISPTNKQLILDFLNACQLGKTVQGREKKRINEKRLLKYLFTLKRINEWLGNDDFRTVSQSQMEAFISRLERNALTIFKGGSSRPVPYTEWTRRDIKVCLKKFYKWLLGNGQQYPSLVSWIDTHIRDEAPPCLNIDEVRLVVEHATSVKGKALVWCLFEGGPRAEELLNVRLQHVEDKGTHLVVRIEHSKTFPRSLPVYEGSRHLRQWLKEHPSRSDAGAQLFPITYPALRKWLQRLGMKALGKRIHPHLMRHSFATWLASKKVGRYQMCKLMGWAMSSDMPDRYIDRLGVVEEEAIQSIREDELSKVERENQDLKRALERLEGQQHELREQLERRERVDDLLERLFDDKEVLMALAQKVREKGLGDRLMGL